MGPLFVFIGIFYAATGAALGTLTGIHHAQIRHWQKDCHCACVELHDLGGEYTPLIDLAPALNPLEREHGYAIWGPVVCLSPDLRATAAIRSRRVELQQWLDDAYRARRVQP